MSSIQRTRKLALVDCNSFYVSCERLFNPKIINKPVVVLSNNDGCVISRSTEAKKIGIKMGGHLRCLGRHLSSSSLLRAWVLSLANCASVSLC